ncbi:MAG: hypothetical protein KDA44_14345 [Planctomycetales bacterium]|nr:hypothetical protein [Planctomycetales bacterium]
MPAVCELPGVRFEYPENWALEDIAPGPLAQATVMAPGTGMWQLCQHPADADAEALFDEAIATLRKEYREIEVLPAVESIDDRELDGYDVNFFYLDLVVAVWLRAIRTPQGLYMIMCQAEDRELQQVGPVFRAMIASLLRSLPG